MGARVTLRRGAGRPGISIHVEPVVASDGNATRWRAALEFNGRPSGVIPGMPVRVESGLHESRAEALLTARALVESWPFLAAWSPHVEEVFNEGT